jgi:tRNA-splicing ligase RtcB
MIAVLTDKTVDQLPDDRTPLRLAIERAIPLSAGAANNRIVATAAPRVAELEAMAERAGFDPAQRAGRWKEQLGTLGSGNHFIEVSADELDRVWLFLHSGSRGVGNKIAQTYIDIAKKLAAQWFISLPDADLAYLVEGTPEFSRYIAELRWAQHYALLNREEMMDRVVRQFTEWVGGDVAQLERINCHHNFTQKETHFGKEVWVSRKGAISAKAGELGLIPGSMGTASYVVEGKGNAMALESSPHGAGRLYSRSKARQTFTQDQLREAMVGIEFRDTDAFIDEIPHAYKPIDEVMADAADLVTIKHTLRQLVNVKGD